MLQAKSQRRLSGPSYRLERNGLECPASSAAGPVVALSTDEVPAWCTDLAWEIICWVVF